MYKVTPNHTYSWGKNIRKLQSERQERSLQHILQTTQLIKAPSKFSYSGYYVCIRIHSLTFTSNNFSVKGTHSQKRGEKCNLKTVLLLWSQGRKKAKVRFAVAFMDGKSPNLSLLKQGFYMWEILKVPHMQHTLHSYHKSQACCIVSQIKKKTE